MQKRVLEADHPDMLTAASDRQQYLSRHGKHAKEEGLGGTGNRGSGGGKGGGAGGAGRAEGAESEVQATQKRAAEGSGACADASKRRKQ